MLRPGSLETVVFDFWERRYDVLVCTTIIESGIDMPSVNTLIVDRADLLGLGQLHQIRGRVGRGSQRAYAYLMFPPDVALTEEAYERLRVHLDAGRQAYVVCPLIEASETRLARAAEDEAERLRRAELSGYRIGLLHGRLKSAERRDVMRAFKEGELDVLVATTVIEVGVDVPNATIMIVQEADRFGLAQLHQLRGRVGRGAEQSYCLLISRQREELTDNAQERLQALVDSTDGFELAEKDLELRGEGQLMGTRQAGISEFRFTKLRADRPLLERARAAAEGLVAYEGPLADEVDALFRRREVAA